MFRNCNCCYNNYYNDNDSNMYENACNVESYPDSNNDSCACGFNDDSAFPTNWMYGHSYVPHQRMNQVYIPEIGLKMGTIFPELVSSYCSNQSMEVMNYLKNSNTIGGGCNS